MIVAIYAWVLAGLWLCEWLFYEVSLDQSFCVAESCWRPAVGQGDVEEFGHVWSSPKINKACLHPLWGVLCDPHLHFLTQTSPKNLWKKSARSNKQDTLQIPEHVRNRSGLWHFPTLLQTLLHICDNPCFIRIIHVNTAACTAPSVL